MPTIQVRVDDKTKTDSTALFNQLGITMSEAINLFLRQTVMRGGIPFTLTVPENVLRPVDSEIPGNEAFIDALKRYKSINNKTDFDITKAEPFIRAVETLNLDSKMRITLQENAVKARLNYKSKEYVLDYNFEEPDKLFILRKKGDKLFIKDCHINEILQTLDTI